MTQDMRNFLSVAAALFLLITLDPTRVHSQQVYWTQFVPETIKTAAVATADLNGDGFTDLVVADYNSSIIRVISGASGTPLFENSPFEFTSHGAGRARPAVGDINGDGTADLLIPTTGGISFEGALVAFDIRNNNLLFSHEAAAPLGFPSLITNLYSASSTQIINSLYAFSNSLVLMISNSSGEPICVAHDSYHHARYATRMEVLPDINGDGVRDIAVTYVDIESDDGIVWVSGLDCSIIDALHAPPFNTDTGAHLLNRLYYLVPQSPYEILFSYSVAGSDWLGSSTVGGVSGPLMALNSGAVIDDFNGDGRRELSRSSIDGKSLAIESLQPDGSTSILKALSQTFVEDILTSLGSQSLDKFEVFSLGSEHLDLNADSISDQLVLVRGHGIPESADKDLVMGLIWETPVPTPTPQPAPTAQGTPPSQETPSVGSTPTPSGPTATTTVDREKVASILSKAKMISKVRNVKDARRHLRAIANSLKRLKTESIGASEWDLIDGAFNLANLNAKRKGPLSQLKGAAKRLVNILRSIL